MTDFDPPAPEGFVVHETAIGNSCPGCVARYDAVLCENLPECRGYVRPDGRWVYFTRAEKEDV